MLQTLLQAKHQQHKRYCYDECDGFRPLQHDFRGGHGYMLQIAVVCHVDGDRPVFLLDQFLDVGNAVGDDVVEHQRVEACDAFLRAQEDLIAHHEEHQLKKKLNLHREP